LVAIGLLAFAATSTSSAGVHVRARTPRQALTYLCAQYRTAEDAYTGASSTEDYSTGGATRAAFERKLVALASPDITVESPSISRFEQDVAFTESFLEENGALGGPSLADLRLVCAR